MKERFSQVILRSGKEQSLLRFHPWVFSGAIKEIKGSVKDGDVVEVFSSKNEFLGTGHYQNGTITVRVFSFDETSCDQEFWNKKITKAYNFRRSIGLLNDLKSTNVYRLVFGEGDGLPGLIIDFFNGTAVVQCHSIGMYNERIKITEALQSLYGTELKAVFDKSSETLPKGFLQPGANAYLYGSLTTNEVVENNNRFLIDWESGQKTGFFIDQRENREILAHYSKGKKILNTFCYTGGFSIYALAAGATEVHSVDSSKRAIELTNKNVELNGFSNHESFAIDTFDFLKGKENVYDVIVLDPPAFAKHRDAKHNAINGYKRLNMEALKQIKSGGILFTFSCSQVVDKNLFNGAIMSAAILAGRQVKILHYLSQPVDHPINIFHPEGEYLKGLVLYVE